MSHFEQFSPILLDSTINLSGADLPKELLLSSEGSVQTFYAPFDYINTKASYGDFWCMGEIEKVAYPAD